MEEHELIQLSREGREKAFAALVNKYKTKVYHLAYSLTRNQTTSDDLAQEIFIKAYFSLHKFKSKSKFGTWLYRIAVNHITDHLRKSAQRKTVSLNHIGTEAAFEEDSQAAQENLREEEQKRMIVRRAIQDLPPKHRTILTLRDILGFTYEEIGKTLGLSPGTVDSRLYRARKSLRESVQSLIQKGAE